MHKTRVHSESVMVNCKVAAVYLAGGAVYSKVYLAAGAGEVPSLETEAWTQIVNTSHPTNTSHTPNTHVNTVNRRQRTPNTPTPLLIHC